MNYLFSTVHLNLIIRYIVLVFERKKSDQGIWF